MRRSGQTIISRGSRGWFSMVRGHIIDIWTKRTLKCQRPHIFILEVTCGFGFGQIECVTLKPGNKEK